MNKLEVVGVRVEMSSNQPIVLLREVGGDRYLPIWIGPGEATAIAFAQQGMTPARPLTHDLFKDVLEAFDQTPEISGWPIARRGATYPAATLSPGFAGLRLCTSTRAPVWAEACAWAMLAVEHASATATAANDTWRRFISSSL